MQTSLKLTNFREAQTLVDQYRERTEELACVEDSKGRPNYLGVTFQGKYQDSMMLSAVADAVAKELKARIKSLKERLALLGVYCDG